MKINIDYDFWKAGTSGYDRPCCTVKHERMIIMKKILFILAFVFLLTSCIKETPENHEVDEENIYNITPIITGFDGGLFADTNITADGYYTGYEKLNIFGASNVIYCNDDNSVIWRDYTKEAIYRLNPYNEQKEKICHVEECRNNIEDKCGHTPVYELIYSNGFLYFTVSDGEKNIFIFRYDTDKHEYEKLIEFQNVNFCVSTLNGRYLYIETYNIELPVSGIMRPDNRVDFTITRIDLFTETAVVIYSDLKNPDDFDKIGELRDWRFIDNLIIMPKLNEEKIIDNETKEWIILKTGSVINISTIDMRNFKTPENMEMENENIMFAFGGDLKIYNGEIYFSTAEKGLSRIDIDTEKREILHRDIQNFSIDDNFLYYSFDNTIYRVKLDYTREINFNDAVSVYAAEKNYQLNGWKVYKEYIYIDLSSENNSGYYRIKINSVKESYMLY